MLSDPSTNFKIQRYYQKMKIKFIVFIQKTYQKQ